MTLILAYNRFMACDSIQSSDGMNVPSYSGYRKVVRLDDGSLFGVGGSRLNADALRDWAKSGLDVDKPPKLYRKEGDSDGYYWIWLDLAGRVFVGDYDLLFHRTGDPEIIGEGNASVYARGVLDTLLHPLSFTRHRGADTRTIVQRTMDQVTDRCIFTAAPVHIFDLDHPELDP